MSMESAVVGRTSAEFAEWLRTRIVLGRHAVGQFLPSIRDLSAEHGAAPETVRRGLKALEGAGLLKAVPRHGFRVLSQANDPTRGCPIAYVLSAQRESEPWRGFHYHLLSSLQTTASRRGWSLLGIGAAGRCTEDILEQCLASRAWGLIVDVHSPDIVRQAVKSGLTAIMVDAWHEGVEVDAVVQDNFMGGMLAAEYLTSRGAGDLGWFGPITGSVYSMGRYGGAVTALRRRGLSLSTEMEVDLEDSDLTARARRFLSRKRRPRAVLALWTQMTRALAEAADDLGLRIPEHLELVGWCANELYETEYRPAFRNAPVPPAITWGLQEMADAAVDRLAQRLACPAMACQRINIPVTLRIPEDARGRNGE